MLTCFVAGQQFQSLAASGHQVAARLSGDLRALLQLGDEPSGGLEEINLRPQDTFNEVLMTLMEKYVERLDEKAQTELSYGAIRGMLGALHEAPYNDPYTRFMDPKEFKLFWEENQGHFDGIGAVLDEVEVKAEPLEQKGPGTAEPLVCPVCGSELTHPRRFRVIILSTMPGAPAERAGVKAGDMILKVDGKSTDGLARSEVAKLIRGEAGTDVKLLLKREGVPKPFEVSLTRAVIDSPSTEGKMLADDIGYLRINLFSERSPEAVAEELRKLKSAGMRGLVLDLRGNPGGALGSCVQVAGMFVGPGPVVYTKQRLGGQKAEEPEGEPKALGLPLAVLVDRHTASAAEILAGAIQDRGDGTVVGTRTWGKGLVQTVLRLKDDSAIAVTTAKYLTPKLRDINHAGIQPDRVVELSPSDLKGPPGPEDAQAKAAIAIVKSKLSPVTART
jgi:carboxyl-terminal processing protease